MDATSAANEDAQTGELSAASEDERTRELTAVNEDSPAGEASPLTAGAQAGEMRAGSDDKRTGELLSAAVGDRCSNCQAALASDQRYCLTCGERRGKSRFSFAGLGGPATSAPEAPARRQERRPRGSSGATLVAGVGTLLLAMGVGVLIGHNNNNSPRASAPATQVITVGGGGGGGAATGTTASATPSTKGSHAKAPAVHLTKKTTVAAAAAATKVLGSGASNLAAPTVKQGGSCTHGAGCQSGKFTGNFFGQ
jgi:hypothetical protein